MPAHAEPGPAPGRARRCPALRVAGRGWDGAPGRPGHGAHGRPGDGPQGAPRGHGERTRGRHREGAAWPAWCPRRVRACEARARPPMPCYKPVELQRSSTIGNIDDNIHRNGDSNSGDDGNSSGNGNRRTITQQAWSFFFTITVSITRTFRTALEAYTLTLSITTAATHG